MNEIYYEFTPEARKAERAAERFREELGEIVLTNRGSGYFAPSDYPGRRLMVGDGALDIDFKRFNGSMEEFVDEVKGVLIRQFYQPETIRKYLERLKHFLAWLTVPLNRVNENCISAYISNLQQQSTHNPSLYMGISALRAIFDGICNMTITSHLRLPLRIPGTVVLEETEIQQVFGRLLSHRDRLLVALLLADLGTVKALLHIRKKDINSRKRLITLWPGLGRSEKVVGYSPRLDLLVKKRIEQLGADEYLFSPVENPSKPMSNRAVNKHFARLKAILNLPCNLNCRILKRTSRKIDKHVLERIFESFHKQVRWRQEECKGRQSESPEAGQCLRIIIDDFEQDRESVYAKGEIIVKTDSGRHIHLRNIRIVEHTLSDQPDVILPASFSWHTEYKWLPRDAVEKLKTESMQKQLIGYIQRIFVKRRKQIGFIPYKKKRRRSCYYGL